ncbi:MAG: NifU family protein [Sandaracinaceae bacterium]|jgi:Fe-S cluster biogenesis protein NfuA|nr:NifU family protein [Sandaracinaceae bacterium]
MDRRVEIEKAIAELIRPLVEADGGTIDLVSLDEHSVTLRLSAACAGCPGQSFTKAHVIEPVLRRALGVHINVKLAQGS